MAHGRYDARRALVLDESNAIGTIYLRTQLLDDARLAASVRLQGQLWDKTTRAVARTPNQIASGLFLRSLNDVIDLHEKRRAAVENLVPLPTVELIFLVGCIAAALIGHGCGLDGARRFWPTFLAALVFVSVGALVLDLDRPARGLITVPHPFTAERSLVVTMATNHLDATIARTHTGECEVIHGAYQAGGSDGSVRDPLVQRGCTWPDFRGGRRRHLRRRSAARRGASTAAAVGSVTGADALQLHADLLRARLRRDDAAAHQPRGERG